MKRASLKKVSEIPYPSDNYSHVRSYVSSSGSGLFLFVESAAKRAVEEKAAGPGGAIFPKITMDAKVSFRLVQVNGNNRTEYGIDNLDFTFPVFDVFPDGKFLVASSRCEWRAENDFDKNAMIIDPISGDQTEILLGDGVATLAIDELGRIWVAYFDEGVFGNFGWGGPGPDPIGWSGLNCFDPSGDLLWHYEPSEGHDWISDCYALNVFDSNAYIYYYTEFSVCKIGEYFQKTYWPTPLKGCHQFAVGKERILFSGQYDDPLATVYLSAFENGKILAPKEFELTLPDGRLIADGKLVGRGSKMHFFDDSGWYQCDVDEMRD